MTFSFRTAILFLFVFNLAFSNASAQENFQPGYLITNSQDTLRGLIDFREWDMSPKSIVFKNSSNDVRKFNTTEISSFRVNNELYLSAVVNVDLSATRIHDLERSSIIKTEADTAFIRVLIDGQKSLLFHKHRKGKSFYYIMDDNGVTLLNYKKYLRESDAGRSWVITASTWVNWLFI